VPFSGRQEGSPPHEKREPSSQTQTEALSQPARPSRHALSPTKPPWRQQPTQRYGRFGTSQVNNRLVWTIHASASASSRKSGKTLAARSVSSSRRSRARSFAGSLGILFLPWHEYRADVAPYHQSARVFAERAVARCAIAAIQAKRAHARA
jgi:hypothetical protein